MTDSLLKGIGCNMAVRATKYFFPEECLVDLSFRLLQDPKALTLAVGAICAHSQIIHPELLLKTVQSRNCDLNVIGAVLLKTNDRRFNKVIEYCKKKKFISERPIKILSFAFKIGQVAADKEFEQFGIQISQLDPISEKKITKIDLYLKNNLYIRNRLLFGCNWRADIISTIELGLNNPTQIKNRLRCSYETAHRVFNEYKLVERALNPSPFLTSRINVI